MPTEPEEPPVRIQRAQELLRRESIDLLLVSPSSDLVYLLGLGAHASERPTLLALRADSAPLLLAPGFEAVRAAGMGVNIVAWEETDDPYAMLADALTSLPECPRVAVSDQAWASYLLGIQKVLPGTYIPASPVLRDLRMFKDSTEIALLKDAGQRTDEAFGLLLQSAEFRGQTEREVAEELRRAMSYVGLNLGDWGPIVASGPNSASPHHLTGERVIAEGDAVVLDFGGAVGGYRSDTTRTVHVGDPDERFREVYEAVQSAQEAGVGAARAGKRAADVDQVTRDVIEQAGYGPYFTHRTGHGLGLDGHEEPYIIRGNLLELRPGMVFSVEPGVYIPGEFGVRIEDIVVVTEGNALRLNNSPRELIVVG